MSNPHGMTKNNLMHMLPVYLQKDELMIALAESIAERLADLPEMVESINIYANIEKLPNELLDILAFDFKVDWWDVNYSVETKRHVLKDSWEVRRTFGTTGSLKTAIRSIYPRSEIQEWFEYGGEPFRFRIVLDMTDATETADFFEIMRAVRYYKRLSAHLEELVYQSSIVVQIKTERSLHVQERGRTGMYRAGTVPRRSTAGVVPEQGVVPNVSTDTYSYKVARCGQNITKG